MRRESSNEIKCNTRNSTVLQHTKNNNFTYQANNWLLQYPLSTVVILWQYHKNFSFTIEQPCTPKWCRKRLISLNEASKNDSKKGNTIGLLCNPQASNTGPKGNADSKQRLIIGHQFFKFYKSKWIKKNSQNTNKTDFGSKTKVPSQQVQKQVIEWKIDEHFSTIFHQSYA